MSAGESIALAVAGRVYRQARRQVPLDELRQVARIAAWHSQSRMMRLWECR